MSGGRTGRAALLLLSALVIWVLLALPNRPSALGVGTFVRLPLELPVLLGLLVATAGRPRLSQALRILLVAALTAITILKLADLALHETFSRPFNPVTDRFVFPAALNLLTGTLGPVAAWGVVALAVAALALLVWLLAWAFGCWARPVGGARRGVAGFVALGFALVAAADLTRTTDPPGRAGTTRIALAHADRAQSAARDLTAYRRAAASDPFAGASGLLDRLEGRDVIVLFVESYGRASFSNPLYSTTHVPTLEAAATGLADAGFGARSLWLTSPIAGGQSWLAHGTFASGLETGDQARYGAMLASDRRTLWHLAQEAGYRTAAVMPAITLPWPEGPRSGFETVLAAADLGYRGRPFNWVTMPDQYTLAAWPRLLPPDPRPGFVQIALISSHAPWMPIPPMLDWDAIGDGRVFDRYAEAGDPPRVVWQDRDRVRDQYRQAIDYALRAALGFAARQAGPDAPLIIVLGDHQPASSIAQVAGRDVPLHLIGPPDVLALFDGWNPTPGLVPGPGAPVWPMAAFRDRFVRATTTARPAEPS
ncbi:sulfatase-like hydrolase/transferase [uncultured Jannaschia sp.]|uniref:sulfatase-like hydrolase/transferase n=1 Tax=uncultured Jannaschia sp. TaxID=293347 RepID=UPI00260C8EA6|nr:sulfatase-like hydrolase/transferase [uncultured Jannaschia sp.]